MPVNQPFVNEGDDILRAPAERMSEASARAFIQELAQRHNVTAQENDITTLVGKNPEDVDAHMAAITADYEKRGAPTASAGGSGGDADLDGNGEIDPGWHRQAGGREWVPDSEGGGGAGGGGASANTSPSQAWNAQPVSAPATAAPGGPMLSATGAPSPAAPFLPDWYRDLLTKQVDAQAAERAEAKQRADAMYSTLDARAKQSLNVDPSDPIIRGQVDAYSAAGERSRRNYLSDVAEQRGPYANLRGEERMTAERLGQNVGSFQSELVGRELQSRRDEIAQALAQSGGMLSGDQLRNLQGQMASIDQAIKEAGVGLQGQGLSQARELGFADLELRDKLGSGDLDLRKLLGVRGLDIQQQLGMADIGLRRELGQGGLDLQRRGQDMSMDQFLRELAQRQWESGDLSDWRWAGL